MKHFIRLVFVSWLVLISQVSTAAIDTYEFEDELTRKRFQSMSAELRCPKCQNQNIADSNSPIAKDLRDELFRLLEAGASDKEIVDFMVTRYGEFVLYRPRISSQTYLLWYAPAALLVIGLFVVLVLTRRKKSLQKEDQSGELSKKDRKRLDELLNAEKRDTEE